MNDSEYDKMSANKVIDSLVARRRKLESILNHHRTTRSKVFKPSSPNVTTNNDTLLADSIGNGSTPWLSNSKINLVPADSRVNRSTPALNDTNINLLPADSNANRSTPTLNDTNLNLLPADSNANKSTPTLNDTNINLLPADSDANRSTLINGSLQADKKIQVLSNVRVKFPIPDLKKSGEIIVPEHTLSQIEPYISFDNDAKAPSTSRDTMIITAPELDSVAPQTDAIHFSEVLTSHLLSELDADTSITVYEVNTNKSSAEDNIIVNSRNDSPVLPNEEQQRSNNVSEKTQSLFSVTPSTSGIGKNISCNDSVNYETLRAQDSSPDKIANGKVDNCKIKRKQIISKSCLDFISNEEELNEDFSGGSSDEWSQKETEISSEDDTMHCNKKRRKKNNTKEKDQEEKQLSKKRIKKENKSKLRKASKDNGSAYETRAGTQIEERVLKENPCVPGKCLRGCFNIGQERRQSIFSHFWSLDPQRRKDWLVRCAQAVPVKRRKCKDLDSRRNNTYEYFINNGEDHTKVCQKFILNTLDIRQKFLLYTVTNSLESMAKKDKRRSNVIVRNNPQAIEDAKQFIENLPAVPSHYCRKRSKRLYLPQNLKNVINVYRIYRKKCNDDNKIAITEMKFRDIFKNDFNISFHTPKKDKCTICVKAENCDSLSEMEKLNLDLHLHEKKATYKRFSAHQKLMSNHLLGVQTITCSFDLQKVLNTPHGDSMLLYYARKYAVFNLTFYESGTQKVYCYIWGECDGKRGGQEIATCVYKYLQEVDKRGFRRVLLYCDACAGQNKNRIVLSAIRHYLKESTNIEVVQINYLLPGHSYMPVDSVHAVIEREVKKMIVWSPSEWPTLISSARKSPFPYNVTCLEYSDFFDWQEIVDKTFTKETTKCLKIQEMRVATFKKTDLNIIEIKRSMKDEAEVSTLSLIEKSHSKRKGKGKGKGKNTNKTNDSEVPTEEIATTSNTDGKLNQLYNKRLTISLQKYKDLMRLCDNGTIPRRFHNEYKSLPYLLETKDSLPETDEDDD